MAADLHGQSATTRWYLLVLVLLASPFYLNDFANIAVKDWRLWILLDYLCVKLTLLILILGLIRSHRMQAADFGLMRQQLAPFLTTTLTVTLVGTIIDQNGYALIAQLPGYTSLGGMPAITSATWNWVDLTFGLVLVGIVEELVFRGYLHTVLRRFTANNAAIVALSSLVFGLAHWSNGLHAVLITALIGAVFMIAYIRTRSTPAIMLAHFLINFIDFADVIPKSIFKLV